MPRARQRTCTPPPPGTQTVQLLKDGDDEQLALYTANMVCSGFLGGKQIPEEVVRAARGALSIPEELPKKPKSAQASAGLC